MTKRTPSNSLLKQLAKSRTAIFGALVSSLGVIEANASVIPDEYRGYALIAIGIAVVWLRMVTTASVGEK